MKCETLDREILWETPTGKQVLIASRRLVSFVDRHVAANHPKGAILASKPAWNLANVGSYSPTQRSRLVGVLGSSTAGGRVASA